MTRRDDSTARRLDELIDDLQHAVPGDGVAAAYLQLVEGELADAAQLLQRDAEGIEHVPGDVAALRRRVLDGASAHDRDSGRARLPRLARRFGRPSIARRVLVPTMAVMVMCGGATALAHTDTSAGAAVRTAARTLNLPAPADPTPAAPARPPAGGGDAARTPLEKQAGNAGDGAAVEAPPLVRDEQVPPMPQPNARTEPRLDGDGNPIAGSVPGSDRPRPQRPAGDAPRPAPDGPRPHRPVLDGAEPTRPKPPQQARPPQDEQPRPPHGEHPRPQGERPEPVRPAADSAHRPQAPRPPQQPVPTPQG
jgi:hypothetical protein